MKTKTRAVLDRQGMLLIAALSLVPAAPLWAMTTEDTTPPRLSIPTLQSTYGKLPLSFEANHGQWDAAVQFVTRGRGHTLFLTPNEAVLTLRTRTGEVKNPERLDNAARRQLLSSPSASLQSVVRMQFTGADPQAEMVGPEPLPGIVNYFIGDDPSKWRTNIPTYQKVGYKDLYPGIDLVYYGNQGQLEYDLVVAPGADPSQIMLAFDGAEQIAVDDQGDLVLTLSSSTQTSVGTTPTLRLHKPVVYQKDEQGEKHLLAGAYVLQTPEAISSAHPTVAVHSRETQQVSFQVASYDARQPLIIDPVLSWATYLGGRSDDGGHRIAVDVDGNVYVTGNTLSPDFPGTANNPIQNTYRGDRDVFVTKLNAAGTAIVYSTYLSGFGEDDGNGIAVDAEGNAYITGETGSSDFPGTTDSPIQSTLHWVDAFVTKLNASGTAIIYSTYLGGNGVDSCRGIALDVAGNAYVTGYTNSFDFPGTASSSIQSIPNGTDVFVTKLNAIGTAIIYSTYLGGNKDDHSHGIAVDAAGNAYVTGDTHSSDFPGTAENLIQSGFGGLTDAFVTKLNVTGTAIVYSTYLGSSADDFGMGIAVDQMGNAYVTGETRSSNFPGTAKSLIQNTFGGNRDAFVTKLNAAGTALLYSTYLGGSGGDRGIGIAVDQGGNAYVTGNTFSPHFPNTADSTIQSTWGGNTDVFVTKLNAAGTATLFSTYLGGNDSEYDPRLGLQGGIAVDVAGNAYVTGFTVSSNFPGTSGNLIQSANSGRGDAFVAKIASTTIIIVNDLVTFTPLASTYRTTAYISGCPLGFEGGFRFDARLTNQHSSPPLSDLAVKVATLSNGNLLQNANGGNGGVGSTLTVPKTNGYADGTLSPGESVEVHFNICLKTKKPFTFFVDVLGMH